MQNLELLVEELCRLPAETSWVEFKHNNYDPKVIGEDISALANSAALHEQNCAYMIWGIDDTTHEITGTKYDLQTLKKGEQELENWLRCLLSKNADFSFHTIRMHEVMVGVLIIYRAAWQTVTFEKTDYIRVGSYTKKLSDYPSLQAQLWDRLRNSRFEEQLAKEDLSLEDALAFLDYGMYFDLKNEQIPADRQTTAYYLQEDGVLTRQDNGLYAITNLGAILFAKRLAAFPRLSRKAIRVVQYEGNGKLNMLKEDIGTKGYVLGFEGLMKYIEALLPSREQIVGALRMQTTAYPEIAIREALANALIHQDFSITGTGPLVEIFKDRMEFTNPGTPLVDVKRIIDTPPKSRNEKMAALMRRLRMCEELGSGWDKIVISCELQKLPAPKITLYQENTNVTFFSTVPFGELAPEDKLRACYMHACIQYVQRQQLTNSSLRERFGLADSSAASISRLIKEAERQGIIKPLDPTTAPRYMKYIPFWA